ncbi:hypothetical protein HMPREF9120_01021 [Neisseria sp. oral taxon 020 str. F0370]|nr:hypothetical protein HMPREF9120_01021 [Neisseria sp. oral taxon 020 str. F0370]
MAVLRPSEYRANLLPPLRPRGGGAGWGWQFAKLLARPHKRRTNRKRPSETPTAKETPPCPFSPQSKPCPKARFTSPT